MRFLFIHSLFIYLLFVYLFIYFYLFIYSFILYLFIIYLFIYIYLFIASTSARLLSFRVQSVLLMMQVAGAGVQSGGMVHGVAHLAFKKYLRHI